MLTEQLLLDKLNKDNGALILDDMKLGKDTSWRPGVNTGLQNMQVLSAFIKKHPNIHTLSLRNNSLRDKHLKILCEGLCANNNHILTKEAHAYAEMHQTLPEFTQNPRAPKIKKLYLGNTQNNYKLSNCFSEALLDLGSYIIGNENLESLSLAGFWTMIQSDRRIHQENRNFLWSTIRGTNMRELDLSNVPMTRVDIETISEMLHRGPLFNSLLLPGTPFVEGAHRDTHFDGSPGLPTENRLSLLRSLRQNGFFTRVQFNEDPPSKVGDDYSRFKVEIQSLCERNARLLNARQLNENKRQVESSKQAESKKQVELTQLHAKEEDSDSDTVTFHPQYQAQVQAQVQVPVKQAQLQFQVLRFGQAQLQFQNRYSNY